MNTGASGLVIAVGTGDWGEANVSAFVEPFARDTGVEVRIMNEWFDDNAVAGLGAKGASQVDVIPVGHTTVVRAGRAGWLNEVDYGLHEPEALDGIHAEAKRKFGFAPIYYSINIAYRRDLFPAGGPKSWANFWDVTKFPAKRGLRSGTFPAGLLESALLADGVPADQLYPLDLDRAFRSLDRIRPHIACWWEDGVDQQQIFTDRLIDLGSAFNGRTATLQKRGLALELEWSEGFLLLDYFVMPRGGPNPANAQKFLAYLSRPDRQAAFASLMPYGPTNVAAYDYIEPLLARTLPSHPANLEKQIVIDTDWYVAECHGAMNFRRIMERWREWLSAPQNLRSS